MSKKILDTVHAFMEEKPNTTGEKLAAFLKPLLEYGKNRSIATRYSRVKKYVKTNFPDVSTEVLSAIAPSKELIQSILEADEIVRSNRKIFTFSQDDVDELLALENSPDKIRRVIWLMLTSGRRISEIIGSDINFKKVANSPDKVRASHLKKQKRQQSVVIRLLVPGVEWLRVLRNTRLETDDLNESSLRNRVNRELKRITGRGDMRSHRLRGMYARYLFETKNPEHKNYPGFISEVLNHDATETALNYAAYDMIQTPEQEAASEKKLEESVDPKEEF